MPKSIIREFDKSETSFSLSPNFSVFVPGWMATDKYSDNDLKKEAKKLGIYLEDDNIYKLSTQEQFVKYIGKRSGEVRSAQAPITEVQRNSSSLPNYEQAQRQLSLEQIDPEHFLDDKEEIEEALKYNYYAGTVISNAEELPEDQKNCRLVKTYVYTEEVPTGETPAQEGDPVPTETVTKYITYRFTLVTKAELFDDLQKTDPIESETEAGYKLGLTKNYYFKIKKGNEGQNVGANDSQMGNQIAYELLGLGYTVYFKPFEESTTNTVPAAEQITDEFLAPLKNKSVYPLRYLISGGCYAPAVFTALEKIARLHSSNDAEVDIDTADEYGSELGRSDCIVLADIDESNAAITEATTKHDLLQGFGAAAKDIVASKYVGIFAPRVAYKLAKDNVYSSDVLFPASFHYLACSAYARERYAEWYAVAGYTRGISRYSISYLTKTFGDIDCNTLAPRKINNYTDRSVNLILSERGNYYLWGNRTSEILDNKGLKFSHFLNIRQLCCTIKQVLYTATRSLTFDPNSDLLWINFVNAIRPTLESMKADQGIRGYKISRVATDKKALLVAKIRIVPIEALEDFDISIYLEDSLSGIVLTTDEEEAE